MGTDAAAAAAGEADRAFQQFQEEGGISNPLFWGASGKQGAAGHEPQTSRDVSGWCQSAHLGFSRHLMCPGHWKKQR